MATGLEAIIDIYHLLPPPCNQISQTLTQLLDWSRLLSWCGEPVFTLKVWAFGFLDLIRPHLLQLSFLCWSLSTEAKREAHMNSHSPRHTPFCHTSLAATLASYDDEDETFSFWVVQRLGNMWSLIFSWTPLWCSIVDLVNSSFLFPSKWEWETGHTHME